MDFPDVLSSEKRKLAIVGLDKQIYEHLELWSPAPQRVHSHSTVDERWCSNIVGLSGLAGRPYDIQPEPFDRSDLQALLTEGLEQVKGCWSIYWDSDCQVQTTSELENDYFRVVIKYRTIQFMARPSTEHDRTKPWDMTNNVKRLHIGAGDIKDCVLNALNRHPSEKMSAVIGRGLAIHPGYRKRSRIPSIPFEWKIDRQSPELLDNRVYKWRINACGGVKAYDDLKAQYQRLRSGKEEQLPPPAKIPGSLVPIQGQRRNLEQLQSHQRRILDPPPSSGSNTSGTSLFGVTHKPSGISVTLPGSSSILPSPAYREQGQGCGQSGQYCKQPDWGGPPSTKGYGDDMATSAADHDRDMDIGPGSTQTVLNAFSPQQGAPKAGGVYQPQRLPLTQHTHVSIPWQSLTPQQQAQRRAFGLALAHTAEDQRKLEAAQQERVEAEQRRVQAEKQQAEAERRRLEEAQRKAIEADKQRIQEHRRQAEAERRRGAELRLSPLQRLPPLRAAPQMERRGQGSVAPQVAPQNRYGVFHSPARIQNHRGGGYGKQGRLD